MTGVNKLPPVEQKSYNHFSEFKNLKFHHKAFVVVASVFIILLTLGSAAPFAIPALIGRLRKLELKEGTPQAETAKKVNQVVNKPSDLQDDWGDWQAATDNIDDIQEIVAKIAAQEEKEKEELDKAFWADHQILDKIIEGMASQDPDPTERYNTILTHEVCDAYLAAKVEVGKPLNVDDEKVALLQHNIEIFLDHKKDPIKFPNICKYVDDKTKKETIYEVVTYMTIADGSCGIYSLIGEVIDGVYQCDADKARGELCEYIRKKHKEGRLPQRIEEMFDDFIMNSKYVPKEYKDAFTVTFVKGQEKKTINLLEYYSKDFDQLTQDKKKERTEAFKKSPRVLEAYLAYLKNKNNYLDQVELEAAAECFNKRVLLFQGGWGNKLEEKQKLGMAILNPKGKDEVAIYYRHSKKHFERAEAKIKK